MSDELNDVFRTWNDRKSWHRERMLRRIFGHLDIYPGPNRLVGTLVFLNFVLTLFLLRRRR